MTFEEYFSFEAIVGDLIRWRVKGKGAFDENGRRDVEKVLPPRKAWSRAGAKERDGVDPEVVRKWAIRRTVMRHRRAGTLEEMEWGRRLTAFVNSVREAVFSGNVAFEKPRMIKIPKGYKDGIQEFRDVASFDNLADRVILSRTTVYARDVLEGVLGDCCYSFRRDPERSHQLAIEKLQDWRADHANGEMYVAECDIKKFFDNISHDVMRCCWGKVGFDQAAGKVLEAYLAVYAADSGVTGEDGGLGTARPTGTRRGLPQGGSFSTVLANLVLHEADEAVNALDDGRLFYARYCDDVVIAHPDESICRMVLEAYKSALAGLELPVHQLKSFVYRPADGKSTDYYAIKSKGLFRWAEPKIGEADCAPWVSFLGSQVRYDGETRIRKESIEKHIRALGHETAKAVAVLQKCEAEGLLRKRMPPAAVKVYHTWFASFRNRLIAKGVGYVTAKVKDCHLCWAGAFTRVTNCADTRKQMRRLDRVREGMLSKVWRMLPRSCRKKRRRYKGKPFSYCGFLENAVRPTNMRSRRQRLLMPYSEL